MVWVALQDTNKTKLAKRKLLVEGNLNKSAEIMVIFAIGGALPTS